jgi:hypothetical protein
MDLACFSAQFALFGSLMVRGMPSRTVNGANSDGEAGRENLFAL